MKKVFSITLTHEECDAIKEIISSDMEELDLDENTRSAYDEILTGMYYDHFGFPIWDDKTALEIVQAFLIYATRIEEAEGFNTKSDALRKFSMQMLTAFTGKTENDF